MSTLVDSYVGIADESTYGTFVPPTNFFEYLSEGVTGSYERIESEGLRAGNKVLRTDRWAVNPKGAAGDFKHEILDVGFTPLLKHIFGTVSAGTPTGGFTIQTATLGDLKGKSLSFKAGRVDSGGTLRHFDYAGGKVNDCEFSNAVDGTLQVSLGLDFASEDTAGSSATPTYPSLAAQLFTFVNGSVTIAGTSFGVTDCSVKIDNALKTDRYALRGASSTAKREPLTEGLRGVSFDIKGEFEDMSQVNRVSSSTTAGALAAVILTWNTPQGGQLTITLPNGRFDEGAVNTDGAKVLEQGLTGKALWDGTAEPITVAYKEKTS